MSRCLGVSYSVCCCLMSVPAFAQVELGGIVRDPDVRGLHRAWPGLVPRRLHRHADERGGARQGAALLVQPPVHDRAAVPGAIAVGGTLPAACASHLERGGRVGPCRGLGHGRRLSARHRQDLDGWAPAPVGERLASTLGLHDRPLGGRHARRAHDARQDGVDPARRRHPGQRSSRRSPPSSRGARTC